MKSPVVVDSSVWIEIFRSGPLASACKKAFGAHTVVGVPTIVLFEIYRKICSALNEESALSAVAYLKTYPILDLTSEVSLSAADIAINHKLAMADSIVLAHARTKEATLLTMDNDFSGIGDVIVVRSKK